MIKYIKLKNYKSLTNLEVDFMRTRNRPKDLILIYGENGAGKSNFATAFYTLYETTRTMSSSEMLKDIMKQFNNSDDNHISKHINDYFKYLKESYKGIEEIIANYKTIDSKENMVLEFGFKINNKDAVYKIEMNDNEIVNESLDYAINTNKTFCFKLSKGNKITINDNLFTDKNFFSEFYLILEKYWGKHSFLSILSFEIEDKKKDYVKERTSESLFNFLTYIQEICTIAKIGNKKRFETTGLKYLTNLEEGEITIKQEKDLNQAESLLNEFFTNLYSDIKGVYYQREYEENKIKYKLYFKKLIYDNLIDINFELESTGTQNILKIFPCLLVACAGQTVIIDELDFGIHDILVEQILNSIKNCIKGQLIITTHNTLLLETDIPKNSIYVFNIDNLGNKLLLPITDFKGRIQNNLNVRNQYLKGMYGGIPFASNIDFNELIDSLD
ncbi:MAG: AAA family ATPase [Bacilli bacterium]|nr:AAA family ATPase [Bacilli bacterium]